MKIVVCGKGGSGKSTVAALLSKNLAKRGYRVLLIDADESNLGLHRLVGIDPPVVMMDSLGGKKGFKEKSQGAFPGGGNGLFADALGFDDLASYCRANGDGVHLLSIGKIHEPGEGCACPMGSLSRMILSRLCVGEKEMVIIDTAAGVEHFGRGIDSHSDLVLGIIDPSFESLALAEKMSGMAAKAGLPVLFILNRMDGAAKKIMKARISLPGVVAEIGMDEGLFLAGLEGRAVEEIPKAVDDAADAVLDMNRKKNIRRV
jgi:CO dehydrogenase maturation factor